MSEAADPRPGGLRLAAGAPEASPDGLAAGHARELFVRHARKDGRSVAILRALDYGDRCVVEAEVRPQGLEGAPPLRPGPYAFRTAHDATAFVTEAVEALMYLGCDVQAQ